MSRLGSAFAEARGRGRKILVAYLCMGDPTLEEAVDLAVACAEAGADVLELGVPFSDPTADGPVIARSSQRALAGGGGLSATLVAAEAVRRRTSVPVVMFGYYNPLFVRGEEKAAAAAHDAGVDGLLVVDLPVEAAEPLRAACAPKGLAVVPLLAPTSSPGRVQAVASAASRWPLGFLYYVSVTGVTGSGVAPLAEASINAGRLGRLVGLPAVVGFGVDTPEKAVQAAAHADGVVVGTALVRAVEDGATSAARRKGVVDRVAALRRGIDGGC